MADVALAMKVLVETSFATTPDLVPPVPWPDPGDVNVGSLRIGYYTDNGFFPPAPALRRAVEEAADALKDGGAEVVPVDGPDPEKALRIFLGAVTAGGGKDYKTLLGKEKPVKQVAGLFKGLSAPPMAMNLVRKLMEIRGQYSIAQMMKYVGSRTAEQYWKIVEARTDYRANFLREMDVKGLDAHICPPAAVPAITHGASEHLFPAFTYGMVYNVLGVPAGVVAATRVRPGEESDRQVGKDLAEITAQQVEQDSAGLPVGVQVVAKHWREDIVLAVMAALETHFRSTPDYPNYRE